MVGRVAEWLKAPDSKSGVGVTLPEVRILSLPPTSADPNQSGSDARPTALLLTGFTARPLRGFLRT